MRLVTIVLGLAFFGCVSTPPDDSTVQTETRIKKKPKSNSVALDSTPLSALERQMQDANLVNVQWLNPNIVVDLKYSTTDNFLKQDIYGEFNHAYLEEESAKKLAVAQYYLETRYKNINLKVWDAARPVSLQQKMWDALDLPINQKGRFVSNPKNHSLHNYGCAIDVTLVKADGKELDMGTTFDQFDSIAQPKYERHMVNSKKLNADQISNRRLLREIMVTAGFTTITSEWWHFNSCSRQFAKENYVVIE